MPVEIRQLVVKANVKDQAGEKTSSESNSYNSKKNQIANRYTSF